MVCRAESAFPGPDGRERYRGATLEPTMEEAVPDPRSDRGVIPERPPSLSNAGVWNDQRETTKRCATARPVVASRAT